MNKILNTLLILLFIIGISGAGWLVSKEFSQAHTCPYLLGIPACIVILVCFLIPLIVHLLKRYNEIYFFFTGIAAVIAVTASLLQLTGNGDCPKTNGGTPMCYYSFLLFASLIIIKLVLRKNNT